MNEYDIAIRETMEMTVTVEAASREEDRRMVEERWKNGEYILDADSFRPTSGVVRNSGACRRRYRFQPSEYAPAEQEEFCGTRPAGLLRHRQP